MLNRHLLVLVSLNNDLTDAVCTQYPESGFIECIDFERAGSINTGLYGTLWGCPRSPVLVLGTIFVVVKTEFNEDIRFLDKEQNIVKFRRGEVVFRGSQEECKAYIEKHKDDAEMYRNEKTLFDYRNALKDVDEICV